MSSDVQLRAAVLEKILKMHNELLWPSTDRWIAWRPADYLAELRRLRAQHNPDAAIRLRLPSLDDPSFFFWSIFNTQDDVFPEFAAHAKISLRRIIGIRNAGIHGDRVTEESLSYLDYCAVEMLKILTQKPRAQSAASVTSTASSAVNSPSRPSTPVSPIPPAPPEVATPPSRPAVNPQYAEGATQILAFYVVCDKSASMAGDAIEVVNQSLKEMHRVLISDPVVADRCWMSVVSFSSMANIDLALTPPHQVVTMPQIGAEGITNYGSAFKLVKSEIDADLPRIAISHRPLRPLVFFMTDGAPSDSTWKSEFTRLVDAGELYAPTVVVIPLGDIDEDVLADMTDVPTGITPQILRLQNDSDITESIRKAIQTMTNSVVSTLRRDDDTLSIDGLNQSSLTKLFLDEID
jgi:uncharacterized protein YegL